MKKSKLKTPDWILKGEEKPKDKNKSKKFVIKFCSRCESRDVGVVIGGQIGMWECHKCGHRAPGFPEIEISEDEFLKMVEENKK